MDRGNRINGADAALERTDLGVIDGGGFKAFLNGI